METKFLKLCVKCKQHLSVSEFYLKKNGKYHSWCNKCRKEEKKKWDKENIIHVLKYREENKEYIKEKYLEYRKNNPEKIKEQTKRCNDKRKDKREIYRLNHLEEEKERGKKWREKNRDRYNAYFPEYHKKNPNAKLAHLHRCKVNKLLRGDIKPEHADEMLGCSYDFFRQHLESLFQEGMSWTNHGFGEGMWHVDHTPPLAGYNLEDINQAKEALHWSHTAPMWQPENISKNSNYNGIRYLHKGEQKITKS